MRHSPKRDAESVVLKNPPALSNCGPTTLGFKKSAECAKSSRMTCIMQIPDGWSAIRN
jgi:hypothetical protein